MAKPPLLRIAAGAAIVVLALAIAWVVSSEPPGQHGCSDRQEQEVATLAALAILKTHPVSAELAEEYSGCGTDNSGDDITSYAGRRYRSPLNEPTIRSFYWSAMTNDGWRNASTVVPPSVPPALAFERGISCLVKEAGGFQARLTISFSASPSALPEYRVEAFAGLDPTMC
ncbi:hypothetical protein [Actinoplanes sp. NPDC051859]|uniref:hypothetical protein n=1 Tax=Actinoplanes sp. NPDC051859 TaxID=3363909 RepID=UPI0037A850FA